jgi:hypothetical protein
MIEFNTGAPAPMAAWQVQQEASVKVLDDALGVAEEQAAALIDMLNAVGPAETLPLDPALGRNVNYFA